MSTAKTKSAAAAAPAAAAEAVKTVEEAVAVSKETVETVVKASADVAAKSTAKAVAIGKDGVEAAAKVQAQAVKSYEDALAFSKENLDAVVAAGNILSKGVQDLSKSVLGLAQDSIEDSVSASKAIFGAKTLRELVDLQASLVKSNFDKLVSEGTRISEDSVKLIEDAFSPINTRINATVDQIVKSAA